MTKQAINIDVDGLEDFILPPTSNTYIQVEQVDKVAKVDKVEKVKKAGAVKKMGFSRSHFLIDVELERAFATVQRPEPYSSAWTT